MSWKTLGFMSQVSPSKRTPTKSIDYSLSYKTRLIKPTGPFPTAVRSSLISVMTEAQSGAARLVPYQWKSVPFVYALNLAPFAL